MDLSFAEVREILSLIERIECASVTLEYGDVSISVQRSGAPSGLGAGTTPAAVSHTVEPEAKPSGSADSSYKGEIAPSAGTTGAPPSTEVETSPSTPAHWVVVRAPMVGTFYRSEAPDKPPFVEVGDRVQAGQTLGLMEVMKLYSDLKSEVEGTVARVDAAHGQLVEYDEPLLWIEPAS